VQARDVKVDQSDALFEGVLIEQGLLKIILVLPTVSYHSTVSGVVGEKTNFLGSDGFASQTPGC